MIKCVGEHYVDGMDGLVGFPPPYGLSVFL
ncbi:hypothetical protein BH10ACI3_BH10ACI3_19260 [soil metagenome]